MEGNLNHEFFDNMVNMCMCRTHLYIYTYTPCIHIYTYAYHMCHHIRAHVCIPPPHIRGNLNHEILDNTVKIIHIPLYIHICTSHFYSYIHTCMYSSSTPTRKNLNHEILDNTVKITVFEALWSPPLPIFHVIYLFIILYNMYVYIYTNIQFLKHSGAPPLPTFLLNFCFIYFFV